MMFVAHLARYLEAPVAIQWIIDSARVFRMYDIMWVLLCFKVDFRSLTIKSRCSCVNPSECKLRWCIEWYQALNQAKHRP